MCKTETMKPTFILIFLLLSCFGWAQSSQLPNLPISGWKFHAGNNAAWSTSDFDDSDWSEIVVPSRWEKAGYPDYDGYGWYRAKVFIPSGLKNKTIAGIAIKLGHVDDRDSTFLNGKLIGHMNRWNDDRSYLLTLDNPVIKWDTENTIAIQVYDYSGGGGLYGRETEIVPVGYIDFVRIDNTISNATLTGRTELSKKIKLTTDGKLDVSGILEIKVINNENQSTLLKKKIPVSILKNQDFEYQISTTVPEYTSCTINYKFTEAISGTSLSSSEGVPYILTPPAPEEPQINGAKVYGVRPGSPIIYRIPVTGNRPMKLLINQLPSGLIFDSEKGIISGRIDEAGEYELEIHATNSKGSATQKLKIIVGRRIALTPPMGWNSWNCWGLQVDDSKIRAAADALIQNGLADYGWDYINIDDGWQAMDRDADGQIMPNTKFANMKNLTDYIHGLGLKAGIYSSPGELTCGGFLGSYNHEQQDVKSWADWGFDYVKYDWCSYKSIKPNPTLAELQEPYGLVGEYLKDQPRDIVYSLCQYGMGDVWKWGGKTGGNLWRTTGDIDDTWKSLSKIGFSQSKSSAYARPGNWNDPDMLVVGRLGWGDLRPTRLTPDEQYTHISLWSLLAAPLLIGCDLANMDEFTKSLLCNPEVIDINQDALGEQARQITNENQIQVWVKPLEDGSFAVGIFNLSETYLKDIIVPWASLKIHGSFNVRDVWRQKDLGHFRNRIKVHLPAHGVILLKFSKSK